MPVHVVETLHKLLRLQRSLAQDLGRDPTIEELAAATGQTPARVVELLAMAPDPVSLSVQVGEHGDSELGDLIEDAGEVDPEETATRGMLADDVATALASLGERERDVVRLRYGLTDGQPHTLEEVGHEFGVTRERVRQIEAKTLAKLRHGRFSDGLHAYLEE
jgi:RNA polymerase primary sigma factor